MLSASTAALPAHRREDPHHGHAHGLHHHHPAARATPEHFLPRNPCDAPDFSEVCACCQGAVDVDELVGLKAAAPHEGASASHNHNSWQPRLPTGPAGWSMAAATTWATVPGLYFGVQNYSAAKTNVAALDSAITQLRRGAYATKAQPRVGDQERNRVAYLDTLEQSRSMQRFISVFAGMLPLIGSACMLGSVVVPVLGSVGSGFLLLYCVSHIIRYMTYEWPRVLNVQKRIQQATLWTSRLDPDAQAGLKASTGLLSSRARLYPTVAAAFGVYAAGASMLAASVFVAPALLVPVGAGALAVGLSAVLYLNNGPIKGAFGKNQDRDINRRTLGSQRDILRRIGILEREAAALAELRHKVRTARRTAGTSTHLMGLRIVRGVTCGLSYGLTFGLAFLGRDRALSRLRSAQVAALQSPEGLLRGTPQHTDGKLTALSTQDELLRLLYERPDQVAHQTGALLDHFHARVAREGLLPTGA